VLYQTHCRALTQLAALLVDDVAAAEEVTQAAFASLHGAWPRLCDGDRAVCYLRQKVVIRARSARAAGTSPPRHQPGLLQAGPRATAAGSVLAALRALPARQREVLVLRYYADLCDAQIASVLGTGVRSVRAHIRRGMASLQAGLDRRALSASPQRDGDADPKGHGA
jgi:DNA-directed RNA polymerase specialized sigma24 family protein